MQPVIVWNHAGGTRVLQMMYWRFLPRSSTCAILHGPMSHLILRCFIQSHVFAMLNSQTSLAVCRWRRYRYLRNVLGIFMLCGVVQTPSESPSLSPGFVNTPVSKWSRISYDRPIDRAPELGLGMCSLLPERIRNHAFCSTDEPSNGLPVSDRKQEAAIHS